MPFLNGPNQSSFCLFLFFSNNKYGTNLTINDICRDGVLGTRTRGGNMVGADESTELWQPPPPIMFYYPFSSFRTKTKTNQKDTIIHYNDQCYDSVNKNSIIVTFSISVESNVKII